MTSGYKIKSYSLKKEGKNITNKLEKGNTFLKLNVKFSALYQILTLSNVNFVQLNPTLKPKRTFSTVQSEDFFFIKLLLLQ